MGFKEDMRVQGVLKNKIIKNYITGRLEILEGTYKDKNVRIYREYLNNKLDLKYYEVRDKLGNFIGSRLLHIRDGKVIKKLDKFA